MFFFFYLLLLIGGDFWKSYHYLIMNDGDTLIFIKQENFLNPGPYDGWVNYSDAFIGDNITTPISNAFGDLSNNVKGAFADFNFGTNGLSSGLVNGDVLSGGTGAIGSGVSSISTAD